MTFGPGTIGKACHETGVGILGRKPINQIAMTAAERQQRCRAKKLAQTKSVTHKRATVLDGALVLSMFEDAGAKSRLISPSIELCDEIAEYIMFLAEFANREDLKRLKDLEKHCRSVLDLLPKVEDIIGNDYKSAYKALYSQIEEESDHATRKSLDDMFGTQLMVVNNVKQDVLLLIDFWGRKHRTYNWKDLSALIASLAQKAWSKQGRGPKSLNENDPLCIFVQSVLNFFGIKTSRSAVSATLRRSRLRPLIQDKTGLLK